MVCPNCLDVEMEREDKNAPEMDLAGTGSPILKMKSPPSWGAEYFCLKCHQSWYYDATGLREIGTSVGPARDVINSYAHGYVDENGQVW